MTVTLENEPWPPLVVNGEMSRAILVRDVVLTLLMWFLFALLAFGELDRVVGHWFEPMGMRTYFERAGYSDLQRHWAYFAYMLAPYLGVALLLAIWLVSFSMTTFKRRRRALRGKRPPPLPLAIEARQAELSLRTAAIGDAMQTRRAELTDVETIDAKALLMILGRLDEAALIDARQLKVTRVHLTREGHYQILPGA
jgi:hypothetical protein